MNEDEASYEETHGPQVKAEFVHFDEEAADPPISSTSRDGVNTLFQESMSCVTFSYE